MSDCESCTTLPVETTESFNVYFEGDDLYDDMLSAIAAAKSSIRLETYIFVLDEVGELFTQALAERAANGVDVRIHLDAVGSSSWFSSDLRRYCHKHLIKLRWFHRWNWRHPLKYNFRDHRKLLIVDNKIAFMGGFNIHKQSSKKYFGDNRWRDTHIQFQGQLASIAGKSFDLFWQGKLSLLQNQQYQGSQLFNNHTHICSHALRCEYTSLFKLAKETIYITTPYFVPDDTMMRLLVDAVERGVAVKLLLPRKTDVYITRFVSQTLYSSLISRGVEIYEYLPRVLHAKTVVIDNYWSLVGTANFDYRSLFVNYEVVMVSANSTLSKILHDRFREDIGTAEKLTETEVKKSVSWLANIVANNIKQWL